MSQDNTVEVNTVVDGVDVEQLTKDALDSLKLDDAQRELAGHLIERLASGGTVGDLYDLNAQDKELIYSVAHSFYRNGKYDKALPIFQFLTVFDHLNQKWWMGLAATWQMMKEYEKALNAYALATLIDVTDPQPQLQAGYCLVMLGKKEEARHALEGAVMAAQDSPAHAVYKAQAQALLNTL